MALYHLYTRTTDAAGRRTITALDVEEWDNVDDLLAFFGAPTGYSRTNTLDITWFDQDFGVASRDLLQEQIHVVPRPEPQSVADLRAGRGAVVVDYAQLAERIAARERLDGARTKAAADAWKAARRDDVDLEEQDMRDQGADLEADWAQERRIA
ncbi:hypothetical protein [Dyella psychrodurans]|uniref:Uncharacterized protein n=1 Tax=Dyella psychrodurans TaxID=1927960 RepID=A0A370XC69_9GAMM|nr:hypothetical protein [Dyella psychrodurans]RDS85877.1 hypothetical protein DWU99_00965 [Dyella psychrodurans]